MTERDIQLALIRERYRRNFVLPNYTPWRWWECDVFELTKSGYFREYEIKLTVSDFKADATKNRDTGHRFEAGKVVTDTVNKHQHLSARHVEGPTRFWYVVPEGLIAQTDLPEWAGLLYAYVRPTCRSPYHVGIKEVVAAPKLHSEKMEERRAAHPATVCYWRLHNLLLYGRISSPAETQTEEMPCAT